MKKTILTVGLAALAVVLFANYARAAEDAKEAAKITGTVMVAKNDEGGITAVTIKAGDAVTKIVLDDMGKKVAEMAGKKVNVTGTWQGEGDAKMLKVTDCKACEEEKKE